MSYHVYPVKDARPEEADYRVLLNGEEVALNSARVSKFPFNRRWPGHQRQAEQSEQVSFLSLATDESLSFEIIPREPFEEVKIRPRALGIKPRVENGIIRFTLEKPAYFTVEVYGRNRALHVFADPVAAYDVDLQSPDVLYFGAGEHDVGLLELASGQTVFIDEGAVVYACIHAKDAENIRILGRGILDNSKNKEEILFEANVENNSEAVVNAKRRHTIQLEYCQNVEIDGITIRDSLVYNIRPIGCENLAIRHVKIIGCWRYNSDGIDMHNCVNVHVSDCFIRTFDDAICVKGFDFFQEGDIASALQNATYRNGRSYDVFQNVLVENCVIWNDWGKSLEIGAETKAEEISAITFRNCHIIHTAGTVLDCMNVDYADVHDVTYRDIHIECDEDIPAPFIQKTDEAQYENPVLGYMPLIIGAFVVYHHEYSKGSEARRGKNHNLLFQNVYVWGDKLPRVRCAGYDAEHKTENVLISNLFLNGKPLTELDDEHWCMGDFTENIRLVVDTYAAMDENTVDAKGQLKKSSCVRFHHVDGKGPRVMFVGNSITLHGIRPEIGWYGEWGMAASSAEKDYVHLLERRILQKAPSASFCICQVASWERGYANGESWLSTYEAAREFDADVIVLRFIENCPKKDFDEEAFRRELHRLVTYLNKDGQARMVMTTGFWRHPGDGILCEYAKEKGIPCVSLGDLGDEEAMKAIGLFAHSGVANHPGDLGMQTVAERIWAELERLIP